MSELFEFATQAVLIGAGATLVMDLWGLVAARVFGFPRPDYTLIGRWIGHMPRGRFIHNRIAQSAPVAGERWIGWATHYGVGFIFAGLLLTFAGRVWVNHPTLGPALAVGLLTVAAPFLVMQPAMGAGVASARTPNPALARVRSLLTHLVFGFGLYGAGHVVNAIA